MLQKPISIVVISIALAVFVIVIWFAYTDKLLFTPARISPSSPQNNVILISVDTLRADHLGIYGYDRNTSPNIDNFAKENILFTQAIAQGTISLVSYASIFTSQYPEVHGTGLEWTEKDLGPLDPSALTMAEVFKAQGYKTAAFVGRYHLKRQYGFHQGFDVYKSNGFSFNDSIPPAVKWLEENTDEKFFLFLQGYDPHRPYEAPEPFRHMFDLGYEGILHDLPFHRSDFKDLTQLFKEDGNPIIVIEDKVIFLEQRDIDHIIAHYDGEVRYADYQVGQFLDILKEMGLYDDSFIVLFSDHGEMVGDNINRPGDERVNIIGHFTLTEEVVHVPLVIKSPTVESKTVIAQAQLIDIFPTLLDFLRITPHKDLKKRLQGRSLVPAIKGDTDRDFNTYTYGNTYGTRARRKFIRTSSWKLIYGSRASAKQGDRSPQYSLYDLKNDPKETENVRDQYPEIFEQLQGKLTEWEFANLKKKLELKLTN